MESIEYKSRFDDYLTIAEAAELLGVSASTLRNWDRQGKVRAYRHPVNGYRLYARADLEHLLNKVVKEEGERIDNDECTTDCG